MKRSRGRPALPPGKRRVKIAFSLPPEAMKWLRSEAARLGIGESRVIESLIFSNRK